MLNTKMDSASANTGDGDINDFNFSFNDGQEDRSMDLLGISLLPLISLVSLLKALPDAAKVIAEQLFLMELRLYQKINFFEYLGMFAMQISNPDA